MALKSSTMRLLAGILSVLPSFPSASHAVEPRNIDETTNFAFSRYLGTGFYTTGDSRVFVLQIPLGHDLKPVTGDEYGLVLCYPLTIGLTDFTIDGVGNVDIPGVNDIATLSLVPGLEIRYPVLRNWTLAPFFDLGIAHDIRTSLTVRVFGTGIKSFATFQQGENSITLGNRFLFADESGTDTEGNSNFAVFETGLDYRFPTGTRIGGEALDFSLYYLNYYYLNDLVIVRILDKPIILTNKNEIGFTFSLPAYSWLPDKPRLGFGVQFAGELRVYRIVFGMPFF